MDFSTLARRELQALCKKNKIPANITNVAMIESLNALEMVEGIDELLNPGESEMEYSPEKSVKTQQSVPRTSCRTSTRLKPAKEENENTKNLTTVRRQRTIRKIAGDVEQAAVIATPAVSSSRKKALVNESALEGMMTVPLTPAAVPGTLRRGTRASSRRNINSELIEERKVYSTRRSVRLSEKKVVDSDFSEKKTTLPIKMDALSEDITEVSENSVVLGTDLPTLSEECSEVTDDSAIAVSSIDSEMQEAKSSLAEESVVANSMIEEAKQEEFIDSEMQEAKSSLAEELVVAESMTEEAKQEESFDSEMQEAKSSLAEELIVADSKIEEAKEEFNEVTVIAGDAPAVEEQSADNIEEDLETTQDLSYDVTDEVAIEPVPEVEEQSDVNTAADESEKNLVTDEIEQDLELSFAADGKADSDEMDGELEVDSIESVAEIASNAELDSAVEFSFQNEDTPVVDETADEPASDSEDLSDDESDFSTDSELDVKDNDDKDDVREESAAEEVTKEELSVKTVKTTTPSSMKKFSPLETDFSSLILADDESLPVSSPMKKSLSPSPLKKSASKSPLATRVLDDKENTDHLSGKKIQRTKAKKEKSKKEEKYDGISLRQLTKMLRDELQITNKNSKNNVDEAVNMRPALQTLPENQLGGGEMKMEN